MGRPLGKKRTGGFGVGCGMALLLSFFIPIIVMLLGFRLTNVYPFGDRSYLGVDGLQQYLPFFTELYEKLHRGGSLFYSWNGGLGYDFWAVISYYLMSPWNLCILFFKEESLNEAVTLLVVLKTGLAGLSMSTALWYELYQKGKVNKEINRDNNINKIIDKKADKDTAWIRAAFLAAAFGIMYALSNYVMGYHVNLMWMDAVIYLPWLTYMLKLLVTEKRYLGYTILLCLTICANYYIGIAVCVYAVLLYLALCIVYGKFKTSVLPFVGCSVLGGLLSGIVLIPAAIQVLNTKAASTLTISDFGMLGDIGSLLKQMLPGTQAVITTADMSLANIYCGSLALVFGVLFFVLPTISKREKLGYGCLWLILLGSFLCGAINLVFHGMHSGYGFPNRHAFLYCYCLLWMGYRAAEEGGQLLAVKRRRLVAPILTGIILVAVIAELGSGALSSMKVNGNVDRSLILERKEYVQQQTADKTEAFVRRDIIRNISRNEAMFDGQKSLSLFSSTVDSNLVEALHQLGFYTSLNRIQYDGYTDATAMMLGIDTSMKLQLLSSKNVYSPIGDADIMVENPYVLPLGYMVDEAALNCQLTEENPFENQNMLLEAMSGSRLYQTEELPLSENQTATLLRKAGYHYYLAVVDVSAEGDGQSSEGMNGITEVKIDAANYSSKLNRIYDLGNKEQDTDTEVTITGNQVKVYVGWYREEALEAIYEALEAGAWQLTDYTDACVKGTVSVSNDTVLFLSIPQSKGWHAYVDGEAVDTQTVAGAFIGFPLSNGEHEIVLQYRTPGIIWGVICTLLGIVILCLIVRREKKKDKAVLMDV